MSLGRAPDFWWRKPGLAACLLAPAAFAYGAISGRRMNRAGVKSGIPIVCVGNFTVGGAGKTPTAIWIASRLRERGRNPTILLRGHGGRLPGPVLVDPSQHDPRDVGDEALLLARSAPTIVSRDRVAGAAAAAALGADVIVMDDGLQNPSLTKDVSLAVFDGAVGLGNGRVLPAGPLRMRLDRQWSAVQAILVIGRGAPGDALMADAVARGLPAFRATLAPDPSMAESLRGRRVLAFAGIGRPAKFFATLAATGAEIVTERAFPDHHVFRIGEIDGLLAEAERAALLPITTEKDFVRLGPLLSESRTARIATLPVSLAPDAPDKLLTFVAQALSPPPSAAADRGW